MPTRYLKPGIRDSELIDKLSPMAEVLFYRLLVTVDDFGRFDARPAMIKSHCFPVKESVTPEHCEKAMGELCAAGLMVAYVIDGKPCLQILKWDNVPRSKESKFPAYADGCAHLYADVCNPRTVLPVTVTVTVTETETKTETPPPAKRATSTDLPKPDDVDQQTWADWCKLRKEKRATVTQTVVNGARDEAAKAGMNLEEFLQTWCRRGSQGLEAAWLRPDERKHGKHTGFQNKDYRAGVEDDGTLL